MTLLHDYDYCSRCASPLGLAELDGHARPICPQCGFIVYLDPKVVAAAIVERNGQVLLVQRNVGPGVGLWALPAGHVNRGEVIEDAVQRETAEETGLIVKVDCLVGLYSEPGNVIALAAYHVEVVGGTLQADGHEVRDARFFDIGALPQLAFPRDRTVIHDWLHMRPEKVGKQ